MILKDLFINGIEIIYKNLSKEDACELEMFLIKEYGRKDLGLGNLVNMTDGGEGLFNLSQKSKDKIGIASSIRNKKPEFVEKLIIRNKNRIWTDEAREKQRNKKVLFVKGHKHKDTTKLKIGLKSSKKVINITTGQIYESAKKCSEENNINKFTLVNWLSGHRTNKSNFRYIK